MVLTPLRTVYGRPTYVAAAALIALLIAGLLVWSSAIITVFPTGGVFINADLLTLATIALTALLMAVSLPLHWFAWRRSVGSARSRGLGGIAALLSIGSLSCCAPLLIPGVLSLLGVSGTSILSVTVHLHSWRVPLFLAALVLLTASLAAGLHGAGHACRVSSSARDERHGLVSARSRSTDVAR